MVFGMNVELGSANFPKSIVSQYNVIFDVILHSHFVFSNTIGTMLFSFFYYKPQTAQAQYESTWCLLASSLKSQLIGKIAIQEARRNQVNKVKRILLKIPPSIYLLESIA